MLCIFTININCGIICMVIKLENICNLLNINKDILDKSQIVEEELKDIYKRVEDIAMYNQAKVMNAFKECKVSTTHFGKTTGYGYDDIGRETIESIYAKVFNTEDSLVRIQFVNGTHTISTVLQALLGQNDKLLAVTGRPYDTLCEVIGITENPLSLMSKGVIYDEIDLKEDGKPDIEKICSYISKNKVKLVHIQRSRGYSLRDALTINDIDNIVKSIKKVDKDVYIMVDNCYGEFTEKMEPTEVGADIVCGSLIKNPGGGLCEMGGYIVGKHDLINLCAQTLTCPGIGKECGATLGQNRYILQGFFMAPAIVKNALKSAIFSSALLEKLGYDVYPKKDDVRSDIVQVIKFGDKDKLIKFIQGIQEASPVDSHVTPYPWAMPGYDSDVIMAAGTFIDGASIELSADSPIKEPYVAYMQGALTYESAKLAICKAISKMLDGN